jgi:transposase
MLHGLCRAGSRPDALARRHCCHGQSRPHKGGDVRPAIDAAGAQLRYLPPYSPDLNPIEQAFSKLKAQLRKHAERSMESLWRRIGDLLAQFTPTECRNFFRHAGYA